MKNLFVLLISLLCSMATFAQNPLLIEHFDYPVGDSLQTRGWFSHSAATTNPIRVSSPGLSWSATPYLGSGVGNAAGHAHRFVDPAAEGYFRRHALPQQ
jgi:hypothetical protein